MKKPMTFSGAKRGLMALLLLMLMLFCLSVSALADEPYFDGEAYEFDFDEYDYDCEIILDDPIYFMCDEDGELCSCEYDDEWDAIDTTEPEQTEIPTPEPDPTKAPVETAVATSTPRAPKKEPLLYDIPKEVLAADAKFATLIEEATKYIGYPYVWGGHCPETSFDCSGFVSYVFTHSGVYQTGGRGATGLYSICEKISPEEAKPGDLIFFQGTMGEDVDGITHVGIFVGNHMMLHCGSPIGYADLTEPFWQKHFYAYGHLPY